MKSDNGSYLRISGTVLFIACNCRRNYFGNIKHPCLHVAFKGNTQNFVLRNKPGYFVQILRLFLREAITARGWFPKLKWPVIHTRSNPSSGPYIFSTRGLLS